MGCTILVADNDAVLRDRITDALKFYGYQVKTAVDGPNALEIALCLTPDLIILDLMLPEMDGLEVCRQLRTARNTTTIPIIMIAASGDEIDIVVSLEVGADAFLTKPVAHRELLARIDALLRRAGSICTTNYPPEQHTAHLFPSSRGELVVGPLRIDLDGWRVICRGKGFEMPRKEFELLIYLVRHPERVLPRDQVLQDVWGKDYQGPRRVVDMHVRKLRQKFERDPKTHRLIQTVHRIGYCFMPDEKVFVNTAFSLAAQLRSAEASSATTNTPSMRGRCAVHERSIPPWRGVILHCVRSKVPPARRGSDAALIAQATSAGRVSCRRNLFRMGKNEVKTVDTSAKRAYIAISTHKEN